MHNDTELFELIDIHNISVVLDPDWTPYAGPDKWMAIKDMEYDEGYMGSEDTGWCHGSDIVGEFVARGSTAKEALIGLVNKLGE